MAKPGRKPNSEPKMLIQTVVSRDIGEWVKKQAEAKGIPPAAWLRRLVERTRQATPSEKPAWVE